MNMGKKEIVYVLTISAIGVADTFALDGVFAVDSYIVASWLGNNCDRSLEIGGRDTHRRNKCSHTPL